MLYRRFKLQRTDFRLSIIGEKHKVPYQIEFEPIGIRGQCPEGISLLDCARRLGVGLVSICGGHGKCFACKIRLQKGQVSPPSSTDEKVFSSQEIKNGWRLACLAFPKSDCVLYVPAESMTTTQRMQVEGLEMTVKPEPVVKDSVLKLQPPTLHDLKSDTSRVFAALHRQGIPADQIDIEALRGLSPLLRRCNWETRVYSRDNEVIALSPASAVPLGLAVDAGTTKIAAYLVDLRSGRTLASRGAMNPQISYGEDITSRMMNALKSPEQAAVLKNLVVNAIDQLAGEMCRQVKVSPGEIVDACIVGNTAIHHLTLGIPVAGLAYSPFVAAVQEPLDIKARDIGLHLAPGAYVHTLSNVAGFVGADHISMLLAIEAWNIKKTTLAIDIGTNTEVSLISNGQILAASCASGPAFEGFHITHGMRAASGAIERFKIVDGDIDFQTIDGAPPIGICGSGVIDSLAQLYLAGILNQAGRILKDTPHTREVEGQYECLLATKADGVTAVTLTQHDIRELQLAKAAIRSGIQILLDTAGCREEELEEVIIAGAFGTYVDVSSAMTIGMFPFLPLNRFRQVGNAAGLGARIALISRSRRDESCKLAELVRYIELATAPNFMQTFVEATYLGKYRMINSKREAID
jgi:uncharacterized 2Fe-2S/4Fe-4S cluster protein (DUF4445 family)